MNDLFNRKSEHNIEEIIFSTKLLNENISTRRHDYYEIEYIVEGCGTVTINDISYPFSIGSAFLITPVDFEQIQISDNTIIKSLTFKVENIDEELIDYITSSIFIKNYSYNFFDILSETTMTDFKFRQSYYKHTLNCILIDFINLSGLGDRMAEVTQIPEPIKRAFRYIYSNFKNSLTLEDVSKHVGLTSNYFSALFHKEFGVPFKQYLIDIRLNYATRLLVSTNQSITDICFVSGFTNFANFSRSFKYRFGISPMQYRKNSFEQQNSDSLFTLQYVLENNKNRPSNSDDFSTIKSNKENSISSQKSL